ncbi:hypothetical protein DIPPA_22142 [Diplonema papillatum]|nr:hypothetical protein DIPPA_22142 [Diplonema papillatum]
MPYGERDTSPVRMAAGSPLGSRLDVLMSRGEALVREAKVKASSALWKREHPPLNYVGPASGDGPLARILQEHSKNVLPASSVHERAGPVLSSSPLTPTGRLTGHMVSPPQPRSDAAEVVDHINRIAFQDMEASNRGLLQRIREMEDVVARAVRDKEQAVLHAQTVHKKFMAVEERLRRSLCDSEAKSVQLAGQLEATMEEQRRMAHRLGEARQRADEASREAAQIPELAARADALGQQLYEAQHARTVAEVRNGERAALEVDLVASKQKICELTETMAHLRRRVADMEFNEAANPPGALEERIGELQAQMRAAHAQEIERLKAAHADSQADLFSRLEDLRTRIDDRSVETAVDTVRRQMTDMRESTDRELAELHAQLRAQRSSHERDLEQAAAGYDAQIAAQRSAHESTLRHANERLDAEMAAQRAAHEGDLIRERERHAAEAASFQRRLAAAEGDAAAAAQADVASKVAAVQEAHDRELRVVRETFDRQVADVQEAHDRELRLVRETFDKQVAAARDAGEEARGACEVRVLEAKTAHEQAVRESRELVSKLTDSSHTEIARLAGDHQARLMELTLELERRRRELAEKDQLLDSLEEARRRHDDELRERQAELAMLRTEVSDLRRELADGGSDKERLEDQLDELRRRLREAGDKDGALRDARDRADELQRDLNRKDSALRSLREETERREAELRDEVEGLRREIKALRGMLADSGSISATDAVLHERLESMQRKLDAGTAGHNEGAVLRNENENLRREVDRCQDALRREQAETQALRGKLDAWDDKYQALVEKGLHHRRAPDGGAADGAKIAALLAEQQQQHNQGMQEQLRQQREEMAELRKQLIEQHRQPVVAAAPPSPPLRPSPPLKPEVLLVERRSTAAPMAPASKAESAGPKPVPESTTVSPPPPPAAGAGGSLAAYYPGSTLPRRVDSLQQHRFAIVAQVSKGTMGQFSGGYNHGLQQQLQQHLHRKLSPPRSAHYFPAHVRCSQSPEHCEVEVISETPAVFFDDDSCCSETFM